MWNRALKLLEWVGHSTNAWTLVGWLGLPAILGWAMTFFGSAAEGLSYTMVWVTSLAAGLLLAAIVAIVMFIIALWRSGRTPPAKLEKNSHLARFDFEAQHPWLHKYGVGEFKTGRTAIRIRITPVFPKMEGCIVWLTHITPYKDGAFDDHQSLNTHNKMKLGWAPESAKPDDHYQPITMFDQGWVFLFDYHHPAVGMQKGRLAVYSETGLSFPAKKDLPPGKYRLRMILASKSHDPIHKVMLLDWTGSLEAMSLVETND